MHTNDFETPIAALRIHEQIFEVVLVLQEVLPTLVPTSFVSLEDSAVHDPPNVVKFVRAYVVEGCNVEFFIVVMRPWFLIGVFHSVLASQSVYGYSGMV
jgi:hypothetical protein